MKKAKKIGISIPAEMQEYLAKKKNTSKYIQSLIAIDMASEGTLSASIDSIHDNIEGIKAALRVFKFVRKTKKDFLDAPLGKAYVFKDGDEAKRFMSENLSP